MKDVVRSSLSDQSLTRLVEHHHSFRVLGCGREILKVCARIERVIESEGLSCRIRTSGRAASILAGLWNPVYALWATIGIGVHNVATMDPDYEIVRHVVDNSIEVRWQRDQ